MSNYINTPLNYTGSKFKLLNQILPEFDYNRGNFVDLFTGGGSVYTNVLDKYNKVYTNDIISDLIGIHKGIMDGDDIIEETKKLCPGKNNADGYSSLRLSYNEEKSPEKLWALLLSCTNNMMRFNQKFLFNQTYGMRGWNDNTEKKVNEYKNHIRQYRDKVNWNSVPFQELEIPSDSMVYIDPPYGYIKDVDAIGKTQISEAGYSCYWNRGDELDLYNLIKKIDSEGNSFMISGVLEHGGNICWILDRLISDGYDCRVLNFDYNKVSRSGEKNTKEVIIKNY